MTSKLFWHSSIVQISVLAVSSLLVGCVNQASETKDAVTQCHVGDPMAQTTLYFGMSRPHGADIKNTEWQQFVNQEVTPRFKNGLTVTKAKGQWLGNDGKIAKENSRILILIHGINDTESNGNIETLRKLYKKKFQQESVMRVDNVDCVSF